MRIKEILMIFIFVLIDVYLIKWLSGKVPAVASMTGGMVAGK